MNRLTIKLEIMLETNGESQLISAGYSKQLANDIDDPICRMVNIAKGETKNLSDLFPGVSCNTPCKILIENKTGTKLQVYPTPEEQQAINDTILDIYDEGIDPRAFIGTLPPKEFFLLDSFNWSFYSLHSPKGDAKVKLTYFPTKTIEENMNPNPVQSFDDFFKDVPTNNVPYGVKQQIKKEEAENE